MQISKNVNNDVGMNPPIGMSLAYKQPLVGMKVMATRQPDKMTGYTNFRSDIPGVWPVKL